MQARGTKTLKNRLYEKNTRYVTLKTLLATRKLRSTDKMENLFSYLQSPTTSAVLTEKGRSMVSKLI